MDRTAESTGLRWRGDWRTTAFVAIFLPLLTGLGIWQLDRAVEKSSLAATWESRQSQPAVVLADLPTTAAALAYRKVSLVGNFLPGRDFLLDNRVYRGRYGVEVISPFRQDSDASIVLVNRGWIAADSSRRELPEIPVLEGTRELRGSVYIPPGQAYTLGDTRVETGWPRRVQVANAADLGEMIGEPVFAHILRLEQGSTGALTVDWPLVNTRPEKHRAYAVQWFAMAAVLLLLYLWRSTNIGELLSGPGRGPGDD